VPSHRLTVVLGVSVAAITIGRLVPVALVSSIAVALVASIAVSLAVAVALAPLLEGTLLLLLPLGILHSAGLLLLLLLLLVSVRADVVAISSISVAQSTVAVSKTAAEGPRAVSQAAVAAVTVACWQTVSSIASEEGAAAESSIDGVAALLIVLL